MKTLILGLGSSILSDDSIGLFVARALGSHLGDRDDVDIVENEEGGFSLLEESLGYDRLVVVDSIMIGAALGTMTRLGLKELARTIHACSPHGMNLATVMEFGRRQGLDVPEETIIYAIEVRDVLTFGERPCPELELKIDSFVETIASEIFPG